MPQLSTTTDRATVDLHAYWYSPDTQVSPTPVHTLLMELVEEEEQWSDVILTDDQGHYLRFIERVVVYDKEIYADQQYYQAKLYRRMDFSKRNAQPSGEDMVATRTHVYLRRIVEMTNAEGRLCALSEQNIPGLDVRDITFIDAAIARLVNPAVPVLDEDRARAGAEYARQQQRLAAGFPMASTSTEEAMVQHEAEAAFPADAYRHLHRVSEHEE